MKHSNSPSRVWKITRNLCLGLTPIGATFLLPSIAMCQETSTAIASPLLKELQQASPKIQACHVLWKRVIRTAPVSNIDVAQREAHTLSWAKENGISDKEAATLAQITKQRAEEKKQGQTTTTLLDFVRVDNTVLSRISYPDLGHQAIEFFDGEHSLFGWTEVANKEMSVSAVLVRDQREVLSHSAIREQEARVLLGIPLEQDFSGANKDVSLQKVRSHSAKGEEVTIELADANYSALTFSKSHGYLISYERSDVGLTRKDGKTSFKKGKRALQIVARDFRQYQNGIWFPSAVTVTTPSSTTEYSLVKAKFNDAVEPSDARLPAGIRVTDKRFGEDTKPLVYSPKDGQLPSDAEAKKMLGLNANEDIARINNKENQTIPVSSSAMPLLGLLCIGVGGMLWTRTNKAK